MAGREAGSPVQRAFGLAPLAFVVAFVMGSWCAGAAAQDTQRIAAVVNDDVISTYDLIERVELVVRTTGLPDTADSRERIRPQVLRALIDERLQLQEAKRIGVELGPGDIDNALRFLERQNRIPEGKMIEALRSRGVNPDTLLTQLEAELKWTRLVQARVRQTVTITDADVNDVVGRIEASQGKPEIRLGEIFLAVDDPSQDAEVAAAAQRLMQDVRSGANFAQMARQFSQSASARAGGDLGWSLVDQLADEVRAAVEPAPAGALVGPVLTRGGYAILAVVGRREAGEADAGDTVLTLELVALAMPTVATQEQEEAQMALARQAASRVTGCDDAEAAAEATPGARHRVIGEFRLGDLVPELQAVARDLGPGDVGPPTVAGGIINILVVCDRVEAEARTPTRDEIRESLLSQRTELASRGYLRDLRRTAFVDVRL